MAISGNSYCCGLNSSLLNYDEAFLILKSDYDKVTYLYTLSEECHKCPYTKLRPLQPQSVNVERLEGAIINVANALKFKLLDSDAGPNVLANVSSICEFERDDLQEHGSYNFSVNANGSCQLVDDFVPRGHGLEVALLLLIVAAIWWFTRWNRCIYGARRCFKSRQSHEVTTPSGGEDPLTTASSGLSVSEAGVDPSSPGMSTTTMPPTDVNQRPRMRSLDTFRGMAIVLMIFVNNGGGRYTWIEHAPWNGLHLADVVFPSFLWIMGVCIPMSVRSQLNRGHSKAVICRRIALRSLKLFLIGLCLNSINGPQLENLRIMGVLQRFGVAYLVAGVWYVLFVKRSDQEIPPETPWQRSLYDLLLFRAEFVLIAVLTAVYLGVSFGIAAPGCPRGYLGPGGLDDNASHQNCTGGIARFVDVRVLGVRHMYAHSTAKSVYESQNFDPEGIFGCLMTIVQVLLGSLAGEILHVHKDARERVQRWLTWSLAFGVLAGALSGFSVDDGAIPINKNLWSLSFVLITACIDFLLMSCLYMAVDVWQLWDGFPFTEAGRNAIILYVGHTVAHKMLPWHWRIGPMNTHLVLLTEALWNTTIWLYIAWYLDKVKFYYAL